MTSQATREQKIDAKVQQIRRETAERLLKHEMQRARTQAEPGCASSSRNVGNLRECSRIPEITDARPRQNRGSERSKYKSRSLPDVRVSELCEFSHTSSFAIANTALHGARPAANIFVIQSPPRRRLPGTMPGNITRSCAPAGRPSRRS